MQVTKIRFPKKDSALFIPEVRERVNAFLADFRAREGFQKLGDHWLREQKKVFAERGIPFVF